MSSLSLDGSWKVSALGETPVACSDVPSVVPGCVHLDLMRAGLISDPFDGVNEELLKWVGQTGWTFSRDFEWATNSESVHELVAYGVDTVATFLVNGEPVGTTENEHRTYRFNVGRLLRPGTNRIEVQFRSPVEVVDERASMRGNLFCTEKHPFNTLRKMACSFGWDWGIDAPSVGIQGGIAIESWSNVRIASVRPLTGVDGDLGLAHVEVELDHWGEPVPTDVIARVSRNGKVIDEATSVVQEGGTVELTVPDVALWWPVGYGEQPLYEVEVEVPSGRGSGRTWSHDVGFKTVSTDTRSDESGETFQLIVNGEVINVRGCNWIPADVFVSRISASDVERLLDDAVAANVNLLRVWGGGVYESETFYAECTKRGLMVWQDFPFACAFYAEEPWLADEVKAEAREQVTRLSKHASLVMWCGSNENLMAYAEWGVRHDLNGRTWGDGYYREILPAIVAELDETVAYTPSSPFAPVPYVSPNAPTSGTTHRWDVWNEKDYTSYRDVKPRFVAEFGFQGPPAWSTLFGAVHDSPASPFGKQMLQHQKAADGNLKLQRGYTGHFPEPRTIDDWHLTTQLNQAAAVRFGVEYFRSLYPYNNGAILWQLNDDWPSISWAIVDYCGIRKPIWYALRDAFAPCMATFQPGEGGIELVILNDTAESLDGTVSLRRMSFDGESLAEGELKMKVDPHGVQRLGVPQDLAVPVDGAYELLVADFDDKRLSRKILNFAEVVEQRLDPASLAVQARPVDGGVILSLTASSYTRDVTILADRADAKARVVDCLFTLLPGETTEVLVTAPGALTPEALLAPGVVRSANQLLGAPVGVLLS